MSDLLSASDIKNYIMECPICTEHFDAFALIPRRMPCCVQSICQPCLETYSRGRQTLSCPLCRHQHHLPGGVKSLPKEPLILKILDYFKIQKGLNLPCTGCPDNQNAVAKCEDCGVLLCPECLSAHRRVISLRDHRTITFDEMRGRPVESIRCRHQCPEHQQPQEFFCSTCDKIICVSCTVVGHKEGNGHTVLSVDQAHEDKAAIFENTLSQLDGKAKEMTETAEKAKTEAVNIEAYCQIAKNNINETFERLIEQLHIRRASLLSEMDDELHRSLALLDQTQKSATDTAFKANSAAKYTRKMRSKADKIEDLEFIVSSLDTLNKLAKDSPEDIELAHSVMSFIPTNVKELFSVIEETGLLKQATFKLVTKSTESGVQLKQDKGNQDLYLQWDSNRDVTTPQTVVGLPSPVWPTLNASPEPIREGKVSVCSCNVGDLALLCLDERHDQYVMFTVGTTLHFLMTDCYEGLGLKTGPGEVQKTCVLAVITDKEYCQAKKPRNRFKVPVGTKFYRVKAKPWLRQKNKAPSAAPVQNSTAVAPE